MFNPSIGSKHNSLSCENRGEKNNFSFIDSMADILIHSGPSRHWSRENGFGPHSVQNKVSRASASYRRANCEATVLIFFNVALLKLPFLQKLFTPSRAFILIINACFILCSLLPHGLLFPFGLRQKIFLKLCVCTHSARHVNGRALEKNVHFY